tara:strand:+ start:1011 stop:1580 length:570 start_codon:yes stop_codon:yes gene_type:complete
MFKKIAIHSFLLTFLLMSCASSGGSSKKSTAAQRAVETREYEVNSKDLMQSTIGAFQDLGFTIDTISEEFGLITASKIEKPKKKEPSDAQKALTALGVILVIGWLIATDGDGDLPGGGGGNDGETVVIKDYKLSATATIKSIKDTDPFVSSLRVNFGGAERKRSMQFFREFFTSIDKSLFLDETIEDLS